ncbi:nitroreductase family protein [Chloroflexi bacterium TSY]|nr:nitroreductase family protein [Chloroflexi bacterium TSY]
MTKNPLFDAIKKRRVCRSFQDKPVSRENLEILLQSARWAPSAGNRRIHKFIVIDDQPTINLIRSFSPGMLAHPGALILICTDLEKARIEGVNLIDDATTWIDVGAAAQNIMLTAMELGLGTCPTTSFSATGVGTVINRPDHLVIEYIVQIGVPQEETRVMRARASTKLRIEEISYWGAFPKHE